MRIVQLATRQVPTTRMDSRVTWRATTGLVHDLGTISAGMTGTLLTDQEILDLAAFLDDPSILP